MITSTPEIDELIRDGAAVAIAVSGGKDSSVAALATNEYLDMLDHRGSRVLIHSDLGSVEWKDSMRICQSLATFLELPLIVVRRKAGGMMQRWEVRWTNNVTRYAELSCVKLILPWSTPSMRFCTSELKTSVICAELVKRFRGQTIINVTGVRREESPNRARTPVAKPNPRLVRRDGTSGLDWNPLVDVTLDQIFLEHKRFGFRLHEAYTTYGSSRVSCAFCIMSKRADLEAAATCHENAVIYRQMCDLEIRSCFSFQSESWLSDVAPELLTAGQRADLTKAKCIAKEREDLESQIPFHLLYTPRWPEHIPSWPEANLLCRIRTRMGALHRIEVRYTDPLNLIHRYRELMAEKKKKESLDNGS